MSLAPGARLGAYDVISLIGVGGMGEVYRARDTKLDRDVAIKVLPDTFASDPDRLARFQREAKTLASLNHPHIGAIYGFEESNGIKALVLELVEGPTLADRIAQGPIPLDEALPIAKQTAEALEAAHEQGIIHRDLKPANIKLTPDGKVKVLDFGLAKAVDVSSVRSDVSASPTITSPAMTMGGVILGTAAYMSPEQAKGKALDKRSDIWAFGCVLYEMLTGRRTFPGEDVSETLAEILKSEPDWTTLPPTLPSALRLTLKRCLDKNVQQRIRDIGDVRLALTGAFDSDEKNTTDNQTRNPRSRWVLPLTALAAGAVTAVVLVMVLRTDTRPVVTSRYNLITAFGVGPGGAGVGRHAVALAPDGSRVAYFSNEQWHLRAMNELESVAIEGTENARELFFSPDGQSMVFYRQGELHRIGLTGGAPVSIGQTPNPLGASWPDHATILIGAGTNGISKIPAAGGTPEQVIEMSGGESAHGPYLLPGGEWVLFTLRSRSGDWDAASIVAQSLATKERKVLVRGGRDARYIPTGHLVYGLNGTLYGTAFDLKSLTVRGNPVSLVKGVMDADVRTGALHYSVSDGSLAYLVGTSGGVGNLVWTRRNGDREELKLKPLSYSHPRVSPDGTRIAVEVSSGTSFNIQLYDVTRNFMTPLTSDGESRFPLWTPDGERVVYYSTRDGGGLYSALADGTGTPERWTRSTVVQVPYSWANSGKVLIFQQGRSEFRRGTRMVDLQSDVYTVTLGSGSPMLLLKMAAQPALSPDGRWIAYASIEAEPGLQVYLRPFPNVTDRRWQISTDGGTSPLWSQNAKEIFFISRDGKAMAMPVTSDSILRPGRSRVMFALPTFYTGGMSQSTRQWDITGDGERFLAVNPGAGGTGDDGSGQIVLVLNWFEELKRLVPTN
jgi:serine/threonine protein kinase